MKNEIYLAVMIDHRCDPGYKASHSLETAINQVKEHCREYIDSDDSLEKYEVKDWEEKYEEDIWEYYCRPREEDYGYVVKIEVV